QRHVAFAAEEALAGEVGRHQRGRTSGLDGDGRPPQVQLVGDPKAEVVLVVGDGNGEVVGRFDAVAVGEDVVEQIGVQAGAGVNADATRVTVGVVTGAFQSLPGALQQNPVLRVGPGRLAGRKAEEGGVEPVRVRQHRVGPNVMRVLQDGAFDAG